MTTYYIVKKSDVKIIRSFNDFDKAKAYAERCCKNNNNQNYIVCEMKGGVLYEI